MSLAGPGRSRFVVGIDLGTTNSVLAYADTEGGELDRPIEVLAVPQLTAPGTVEARTQLPSFLLLPEQGEFSPDSLRLPWQDAAEHGIVGTLAARRAAEAPDRVITSAKSWLCHCGVDRTAPILPWLANRAAQPDMAQRSPVAASAAYLAHLRSAWDAIVAREDERARLAVQEVFLTVPASFDASARDLTLAAARSAGLERVYLLEEPQAAVYAWLERSGEAWREQVGLGDVLLVCDVGGGTTDFSVVRVEDDQGELTLERVAVGDHLLLGGDNMDLALAYGVRQRLSEEGKKLDAWQFRSLVQACREVKELLLGAEPPDSAAITILGRSSKLIGGTVRTTVSRELVGEVLLEGFFPRVGPSDYSACGERVGLSEIGLPFASDAAITRHLARFLALHGETPERPLTPNVILFNGGVMAADTLRQRVSTLLADWSRSNGCEQPSRVLSGSDLAHAVARGAAYYGLARRGRGIRIRGGTARSYYVGVASAMPAVPGHPPPVKALCVVPFGIEEGTELDVPAAEFGLLVGESARFRFFSSSTRDADTVGQVLDEWETEELEELAPLAARLEGREAQRVAVRLAAHVTEIGTLELWFVAREGGGRWKLELSVREARA